MHPYTPDCISQLTAIQPSIQLCLTHILLVRCSYMLSIVLYHGIIYDIRFFGASILNPRFNHAIPLSHRRRRHETNRQLASACHDGIWIGASSLPWGPRRMFWQEVERLMGKSIRKSTIDRKIHYRCFDVGIICFF